MWHGSANRHFAKTHRRANQHVQIHQVQLDALEKTMILGAEAGAAGASLERPPPGKPSAAARRLVRCNRRQNSLATHGNTPIHHDPSASMSFRE
jgi:hypothetical protein